MGEYRTAGLAWGPKNGAFQSLDELGQVYGMGPALLEKLRPYLGLHSGLAGIDAALAGAELVTLLRDGIGASAGTFGNFPALDERVTLPAIFVSASRRNVFGLRVAARTASGAVFLREAVIHLGSPLTPRHSFLRWTRGSGVPAALEGVTVPVPDC
jgi:general secretion pathway protein K